MINALNATRGILFTLAVCNADRFGRRRLFIIGAVGVGTCMLIIPVIGIATPNVTGAKATTKTKPVGTGIVTFLFIAVSPISGLGVRRPGSGRRKYSFFPIFLVNEDPKR
ncbi:uncharacterized protein F4807DRAFT_47234 [Annulohypoxylon truncatum]|uniref:uncharacterized protein n=1 Tax=Annulohypoxylon truncatum TaxID=327061 RepID=UPI002007DDA0|nr:uncharacterized protein F4807DRAFT_47234 [Annulohypoxylon truncatum]KAI1211013.1 hypothetical protein F4807DRAFT_47234 [Annulohypoxylon truncatum]